MSWLKFHQIVLWKETAKLLVYLKLCSQGLMMKTTKTTSPIIKCCIFFRQICVCMCKRRGRRTKKEVNMSHLQRIIISTAQQQPNPNKSRTPLKKISNSRVRHSPCSVSSTLQLKGAGKMEHGGMFPLRFPQFHPK